MPKGTALSCAEGSTAVRAKESTGLRIRPLRLRVPWCRGRLQAYESCVYVESMNTPVDTVRARVARVIAQVITERSP